MASEGMSIGPYRLVRRIGAGSCGEVFEAYYEEIKRRAAVKILFSEISQDPEMAMRFLNEARAVNIVQHPGIVSIYQHGKLRDGTTYIVMEYLDGVLLRKRIGALTLQDALRLARQIASTLAAAHEKNIIHRDLKPENLMIVPDAEAAGGERVKVLDFGIAKVAKEYLSTSGTNQLRTHQGTVMGTPQYMSPEQCRGESDVTDRADVYALGVMLYEMVTGSLPFVAKNPTQVMLMQVKDRAPSLRDRPGVPRPLADLVDRMLDKQPARRPGMKEVVSRLVACGAAQTASLPMQGLPNPSGASRPERWIGAGVLAGGLGAAIVAVWHHPQPRPVVVSEPPRPRTEQVRWSLRTTPPGAAIIDERGQVLGVTPWEEVRDKGRCGQRVTLRLPGWREASALLDCSANMVLHEVLTPQPPPAPPEPEPPPRRPERKRGRGR